MTLPLPTATGSQTVRFGWGSLRPALREILDVHRPRRVVLFAGPRSYASSGAAATVDPLLRGLDVTRFERSDSYPTIEEVLRASTALMEAAPDLAVAVGGGGVLDVAKASRLPIDVAEDRSRFSVHQADGRPATPLVAVPTTAGTGAESTRFAVVYLGAIKHSVDDPRVLPDHAIVDPSLTQSVGPRPTAVAGMDALAQGIESIWSVASTAASRRLAAAAVRLAWQNLERAVIDPDPRARSRMALAAHLAGRAIDITRTTASHAASYPMTARFGIPHGHAVALTLPAMLVWNAGVRPDDVIDPAGVAAVRGKLDLVVDLLGARDPDAARERLLGLMRRIGLETSLAELGVTDLDVIVAEGLNPQRAGNNPRRLTPEALRAILGQPGR